jgi:hypothetical protein
VNPPDPLARFAQDQLSMRAMALLDKLAKLIGLPAHAGLLGTRRSDAAAQFSRRF